MTSIASLLLAARPTGLPDDRNAIFSFVHWSLATLAAVTLLWPVNIPLAALAYKLRLGDQPVPMEAWEYWRRSLLAALGLTGITLVMLGLAYLLVQVGGFPSGMAHLVLFLGYVPAGAWYMFWVFALEDMLQGLAVFLAFVLVGGLPVLLLAWLTGAWKSLAAVAPWLLPP